MGSTLAPDPGLTCDGFLGGRLQIWQPRAGYRAGVDAVLLAAAVPAQPGQSVLDLGCGVGVAGLCLGWRVPGLALCGLEVQSAYADLARRNAAENRIALAVHTGDLSAMPSALRQQTFDHVIANPPYFHAPSRTAARDAGRETAQAGPTPLTAWIDSATRRLRPGGLLTMIQRADRLRDLLAGCDGRLGTLKIRPIQARTCQPAQLVLLSARKGGKTPLVLDNPLILNKGLTHEGDRESYTESIRTILRDGSPLI